MKQITKTRKAVATMANQLRKLGYTLSNAFKTAWKRIKDGITVKAAGVTFDNRQERLHFLKQFKQEDLTVTLERERNNKFDSNTIQIVVHIKPIRRRTVIGYIPKGLTRELFKVIDMGIQVKASLMQIIGGYSYKQNVIHVTKTVTFNEDNTRTTGTPKSESGKRDIPLNDTIKGILAKQRKK